MNKKYSAAIITLGCDKNRVDSEIMAGILNDKGYNITTSLKDANFIIVNTCTFIKSAIKETEDAIRLALNNEKAKIIVSGCHSQRYKEKLMNKFPDISAILGINYVESIDTIIEELQNNSSILTIPFNHNIIRF